MHRQSPHRARHGVTLIELLVVIGILLLLYSIMVSALRTTNASAALDTETLKVSMELKESRSLTLSSKNANQFGVHLASSSVTIFEGALFVAGSATNTVMLLNPQTQISSIALSGGGSDVVFERLTGKTSTGGTIRISLTADPSKTKTITVYPTGVTEIQ